MPLAEFLPSAGSSRRTSVPPTLPRMLTAADVLRSYLRLLHSVSGAEAVSLYLPALAGRTTAPEWSSVAPSGGFWSGRGSGVGFQGASF